MRPRTGWSARRSRLWAGIAAATVAVTTLAGAALLSDRKSASPPRPRPTPAGAAAASNPDPRLDALLQAGIRQDEANDPAGARRSFQQLLRLDADNKLAWYNLGVLAQRDGRTAEAAEAYDRALSADADFAPALYNMALLLVGSDTDQAITVLRRIVAADPKAATAYMHLGHALARKGRYGEAREAYARAVRAAPSLRPLVLERRTRTRRTGIPWRRALRRAAPGLARAR